MGNVRNYVEVCRNFQCILILFFYECKHRSTVYLTHNIQLQWTNERHSRVNFYYSNVDSVEKVYIEESHDFEINHERGLDSNNWIPEWKSIKMYNAPKAENVAVCMCGRSRNAWKFPAKYYLEKTEIRDWWKSRVYIVVKSGRQKTFQRWHFTKFNNVLNAKEWFNRVYLEF